LKLVYDLGKANVEHSVEHIDVEYIADDRRKESLDGGFFSLFGQAQREEMEVIATETGDSCLALIRA